MRKKTRKTKPFFSLDEHDITILQNHQYFLKYQILLFIYYYSCYYFFVTISYHCILLLLGYYFHITTFVYITTNRVTTRVTTLGGFSKIKIVTPLQKWGGSPESCQEQRTGGLKFGQIFGFAWGVRSCPSARCPTTPRLLWNSE